jgi:hypothetical protein
MHLLKKRLLRMKHLSKKRPQKKWLAQCVTKESPLILPRAALVISCSFEPEIFSLMAQG